MPLEIWRNAAAGVVLCAGGPGGFVASNLWCSWRRLCGFPRFYWCAVGGVQGVIASCAGNWDPTDGRGVSLVILVKS